MKTILLWSFWMSVVGVFVRMGFLAFSDYPRSVSVSRIWEVLWVAIGIAWCIWIAWTLWAR